MLNHRLNKVFLSFERPYFLSIILTQLKNTLEMIKNSSQEKDDYLEDLIESGSISYFISIPSFYSLNI